MTNPNHVFGLKASHGTHEVAKSLYCSGHAEEAIRLLSASLESHPHDGRSWEMLGTMYHAKGQIASAVSALEFATTLVPLSIVGQFALADSYLELDMPETATAMFEHLASQSLSTELTPNVVQALAQLGLNFHALELSREAAVRNPHCHEAWFAVAHHMCLCGYPTQLVLPVLHQAIELAPSVATYRVTLAKLAITCDESEIAYAAIANLPPADLRQLNCTGCLMQFERLYESTGDDTRRVICRDRYVHLLRDRKG